MARAESRRSSGTPRGEGDNGILIETGPFDVRNPKVCGYRFGLGDHIPGRVEGNEFGPDLGVARVGQAMAAEKFHGFRQGTPLHQSPNAPH